ncbi:MAG TPA: hypothetical protein VHZ97_25090 [Pseudonocardiaceae bacterium]|nr:hypothetical protein [Pseudonocardiaceae bacterium]
MAGRRVKDAAVLGLAVLLLAIGLNCVIDVLAPWASLGPHVTVTVTVPGVGGRHADDGSGTYQDANGVQHKVDLYGDAVSSGQRVPATLSLIPWDRDTVYIGAIGPVHSDEAWAAPLLLLVGGAIIWGQVRRRRRAKARPT